ncbi:MAG: cytochrome P450 [Pseudomonadota bacterium]
MFDKMKLQMKAGMAFRGAGAGLFAPDRIDEAIALYDEIRKVDPVFKLDSHTWLLSRYDDAKAVLRDTRFSNNDGSDVSDAEDDQGYHTLTRSMLYLDPPDHTRLRRLVQQAFQPRHINQLEGAIEEAVDGLLDAAVPKGHMDLMAELAHPLPVWVICTMLDVPLEDRDEIQALAVDSALLLDYEFLDEATRERGLKNSLTLRAYFDDLIDKRRANPGDDIMSGLITAETDGQRLTQDELVSMADLLFVAGHETTVNLIGNGTRAMLDHPGSLERLAAEPDLVPSAVEECLRYTPSVTLNGRIASEELTIADKTVEKGSYIIIPTDAVNRDPLRFPDPHRFDIARADNAHLTFSIGPHICLGASLARLEAKVAWRKLLARVQDIQATAPSPWRPHVNLRGLESLNVSFRAAS